jgi:hypothetical protein
MHAGAVHMPLRLGVYVITEEERARISEWLPPEFVDRPASHSEEKAKDRKSMPLEERLREVGLKTHTVLSHIFQSSEVRPLWQSCAMRWLRPCSHCRCTLAGC